MKIKEGFVLKDVAGNKVVLPVGERQAELKGFITFNDVGADVFNMLDGTNSVEEIVNAIVNNYNAPHDVVLADVNNLIEKMRAQGLIEE